MSATVPQIIIPRDECNSGYYCPPVLLSHAMHERAQLSCSLCAISFFADSSILFNQKGHVSNESSSCPCPCPCMRTPQLPKRGRGPVAGARWLGSMVPKRSFHLCVRRNTLQTNMHIYMCEHACNKYIFIHTHVYMCIFMCSYM